MLAYLALGSNLGERRRFLQAAVVQLQNLSAGACEVSRLYETDPVGGPQGQGAYLNLVLSIETDLEPEELLGICQKLEAEAGRDRSIYWGPRTLDVDILLCDDLVVDLEDLTIPHPRMYQRRFVLEPLQDIAPELLPDGWEEKVDPGKVWAIGEL